MREMLSALPTRWRPDDPGLSGLRQATRAALVIPSSFAFAKFVIGDVQFTTFVVFGCFALLVIADFGGLRRPRAVAYISATLVGVVLVTLGTLASSTVWSAVLVMFLVGVVIQFAGVFGSYVAASQTALLLCFVLAVSVPASPSALGARLGGWLLAGLVSTLSGVFFWPRFERLMLRRKAADACRALAVLIKAQRAKRQVLDIQHIREAAQAAVETARRRYTATPKRPAGPARRDRAFVELLTELERLLEFATRPFGLLSSPVHPCTGEGNALSAAVVQVLDAGADVLNGGAAPDLLALDRARFAHREALDRWASEALRTGTSAEDVLAGLDVDHRLRLVSYVALAIGTNAVIAAGGQPVADLGLPAGTPRHEGTTGVIIRIARTVRTHLTRPSSVLHHSLRVGIGLALAVLLARLLRLDHAFWVVLGTLSVLRSNAFGTGRTTVEALTGTVAGFVVGTLFTLAVGPTSPIAWVALPIVVFLATYSASAIGFVVSQTAFTVLVIMLFNLISPVGWRLGLARVEDVAIGTGVSVVACLLLWPRGARGELAIAVAGLYRAVAAFLASSFAQILEPDTADDAGRSRRVAEQARDLAGEALDQFLNERGAKPLKPETGAFLVAAGTHAIMAGDLLQIIADMGYQARNCGEGATALGIQVQLMLANFVRLADRLEGKTSPLLSGAAVSDDALRAAALACLRRWQDDPASGRATMAVVMGSEWTQQLGELTHDLEAPVAKAVKSARVPWWR